MLFVYITRTSFRVSFSIFAPSLLVPIYIAQFASIISTVVSFVTPLNLYLRSALWYAMTLFLFYFYPLKEVSLLASVDLIFRHFQFRPPLLRLFVIPVKSKFNTRRELCILDSVCMIPV